MQPLTKNLFIYLGLAVLFVFTVGMAGYLGTRSSEYNTGSDVKSTTEDQVISPVSGVVEADFPFEVLAPVDQFVSTTRSVVVRGVTVPNADVGINEVDIVADARGNFQSTLLLDEGENQIVVIATTEQGIQREKILTITVSL